MLWWVKVGFDGRSCRLVYSESHPGLQDDDPPRDLDWVCLGEVSDEDALVRTEMCMTATQKWLTLNHLVDKGKVLGVQISDDYYADVAARLQGNLFEFLGRKNDAALREDLMFVITAALKMV